jgi:hypothetical protein
MYLATVDCATPKLEQLAMNVRRTPEPVLKAHASDQGPQLGGDGRSAAQVFRFPAPVMPKAGPMPAHHRFRLDDPHCLQDRREQTIKQHEE